ncbi:MAG: sigma-70 family RNA polymerase sigma factor [Planctomycetaceae bacterium]
MTSNRTSHEQDSLCTAELSADVLAGCCAGDRGAQKSLYDRCQAQVYCLMVRLVGVHNAEDLTQQVFLQVFRKLHQFAQESRFETWLYRLATNEALQFLRKERRWRFQPLLVDPMSQKPEENEGHDRRDLLEHALLRLDPELRSVFVLKELESLSYREIAEAMEIPEGTVGSRLNRARRELQQHLTELGWEA